MTSPRGGDGDGVLARAVLGGRRSPQRARALLAELARGVDYHAAPRGELLARFGLADPRAGLSRSEARRAAAAGRNSIPSPQQCPAWLCCILPCLNSTPAMRRYHACLPEGAEVVRNGRALRMDASALVVGDVVLLRPGCVVPADVRLLGTVDIDGPTGSARRGWIELDVAEFCGCGVETGRLLAPRGLVVERAPSADDADADPADAADTAGKGGERNSGSGSGSGGGSGGGAHGSVLDATNVAFAGTSVARGSARAVVCATGRRTLMGRLIGAQLWPLTMSPAAGASSSGGKGAAAV